MMSADPPPGDDQPVDSTGSQGLIVQSCARCGLALAESHPQSRCPRCALRLVLGVDEADHLSFAADDAVQMRYGHFEVVLRPDGLPMELGSGAMATTYRALDTILRLPVALKVISQRVAGHPAARARFLREARAAGRLHHHNVASVTYYGEQDGECYHAMELVEGETLAERVRRLGPFSPEQAMEVGVQVARALAAAEAAGVVHRDLKPSNLMLVGAPGAGVPLHVKVIDWGLAKAIRADDELLGADHTRHAFVGTPAFASPEQFALAVNERRVDTRSDIYSLGVTLWFLLCGKVPFLGDTLSAIHARQKKLPLQQLAAAKVPGYLTEVLRRMVAFDPAAWPQSARELLDELSRCQQKSTGQTPQKSARGRLLPLATVSLVVLIVGAGTAVWRWRHTDRVPAAAGGEKFSLAVLPFEFLGADKSNEIFVASVQDEIANDLARGAALDVIGTASTGDYPPGPTRDLPRIGQELGVRYLLEGAMRRQSDQMVINVRLSDLRDPGHPWGQQYTRGLGQLIAVQGEITRAVAAHLQVTLSSQEKELIDRVPTRDFAAYDLYLRGRDNGQVFQTVEQEYHYRLDTSVPLLEQAVHRDPQFAIAYAELVSTYVHLSVIETSNGKHDAAAAYQSKAMVALERADQLQPDAGEVHLAHARLFHELHANSELAFQALELARRTLPNSADVEILASVIAGDLGHAEEAIHHLERAVLLEPRNADRRFSLAAAYRLQRNFEKSDLEIARVIAALPRNASLSYRMFRAIGRLEEHADLAPLRDLLGSVTSRDAPLPEVVTKASIVVALFSRDAAAATRLLADIPPEGLQWGEFALPKAWFEALAARLRHDGAAAREAFTRARMEEERILASDANKSYSLSVMAMIDAGLGNRVNASNEMRQVSLTMREQSSALAPVVACQLAVAYGWLDEPDLACQILEPWVDQPAGWSLVKIPNYGDFRLNPVWDEMQGNPRFAALVAKFAPKAEQAPRDTPYPHP